MPQPFTTELDHNNRFLLKDPEGKVLVTLHNDEPYEANEINDAFAKFAEAAHIPLVKAKDLYVHPYPPDGP